MSANHIKAVLSLRAKILWMLLLTGIFADGSMRQVEAQAPKQASEVSPTASIAGQVVDQSGRPVSSALVNLKATDATERTTATDPAGAFFFKALPTGTYSLSARKSAPESDAVAVTVVGFPISGLRILLRSTEVDPPQSASSNASPTPSLGQAAEFSDNPRFTIAGVTDWTAVGGHGSDATLRTSEDLARETLALRAEEASKATVSSSPATEKTLRAAVTANSRSYEANRALGNYYLRSARYAEAVPLLKAATSLHAAEADDEYSLALAYNGAGDLAEARHHVERALSQKDVAAFHRLSGELAEKLGDPLTAVQQEERATRMDPSEENYFVWGSELLLHRAIWESAEVLGKGAKAFPASSRLKVALGAALFGGAHYDEAADQFCAASDLQPAEAEPYVFLGRVALASPTLPPCAQERLARFFRLQPREADATYYNAMLLLKQGSADELPHVRSLLQKTVALDPKYAEAYLQLGVLSFGRRNYAEAIELFSKAASADPAQAEAHYRLGVAYDRTGRPELAKQEFKIHDDLAQRQAQTVEQQRRDVKQFFVVLQEKPTGSTTP